MLHVAHAAKHDYRRIQVRTADSDVIVLAVMEAQALPVWMNFGLPVGRTELSLQ